MTNDKELYQKEKDIKIEVLEASFILFEDEEESQEDSVCKICGEHYEFGSFKDHVLEAHPTEFIDKLQDLTIKKRQEEFEKERRFTLTEKQIYMEGYDKGRRDTEQQIRKEFENKKWFKEMDRERGMELGIRKLSEVSE